MKYKFLISTDRGHRIHAIRRAPIPTPSPRQFMFADNVTLPPLTRHDLISIAAHIEGCVKPRPDDSRIAATPHAPLPPTARDGDMGVV